MNQDLSSKAHARRRNAAIFAAIVVVWLVFDQATKRFFDSFVPGDQIGGPYLGLFDFMLVHNTGGAWGILGDMTLLLGVFSVAVCILAAVYLFYLAPDSSVLCAAGLSLVVAGGIGNAIDRFSNAYVIDFIHPVFIEFPVFNIADIGVTCGIVLFVVSLLIQWAKAPKEESAMTSAPTSEEAPARKASVTRTLAPDEATKAEAQKEEAK